MSSQRSTPAQRARHRRRHRRRWARLRARTRARSGLLGVAELRRAGVPLSTARLRAATGEWQRPQRGVYLVGLATTTDADLRRVLAVQIRAGEPALVTGEAAAWVIGVLPRAPRTVEVLLAAERRIRTPAGARLRRTARFGEAGVRVRQGVRMPHPSWVLTDLAATLDDDALSRAVATACRLRLTSLDGVEDRARRRGRFPGCGRLRRVLAGLRGGLDHSHAERRLRLALSALGLEPDAGKSTIVVDGRPVGETDVGFSPVRVDAQVDGPHHYMADQAAADRGRDRLMARAGWQVVRVGVEEVDADVGAAAAQVAAIVRGRRSA